jgi:guanylate kinase
LSRGINHISVLIDNIIFAKLKIIDLLYAYEVKMSKREGRLFVISAPSGSGKTTLCERLIKKVPGIIRSVSLTTRQPRKGEVNGRDYIFVTKEEFDRQKRVKGLLEWARNFGYYYGTPKAKVLKLLANGTDVVLAIDVKGAMKVKRLYSKGVFIFILPPSMAELKNRLRKRKTDDSLEISKRMRIAKRELLYLSKYTYAVVNDNLKEATEKLKAIIIAERCRI